MCKKSNNHDLPEDLVADIVSRLPVKSLKRFRCVCKPWCSRFETPDFITNHHLKQKYTNNFSFFIKHQDGHLRTDYPYFSELTQALNVKENIRMQFLNECIFSPEILGPRNGILCVHEGHRIALWNPATREFKLLPESHIERPPFADSSSFGFVGFGFDSKTNDYKVLRFVDNYFDEGMGCDTQYELYTLNSNSWREIPLYDDVFITGCTWLDTYVNGFLHWQVVGRDGCVMVLSFDLTNEVFSTLPLTDFGVSWTDYKYFLLLATINESLGAIIYLCEGNEKCFDIWVMKEYGVKESWTKQLAIGPIYGVNKPLGFWKNIGLFLGSSDEQLVLYDPQTEELQNLQIRAYELTTAVVRYVESLVPISGRQELEEQIFRTT